eukprot:3731444-Rhodomonas_salina.5
MMRESGERDREGERERAVPGAMTLHWLSLAVAALCTLAALPQPSPSPHLVTASTTSVRSTVS